jgi:Skp family chaperone for outer membrane proteins
MTKYLIGVALAAVSVGVAAPALAQKAPGAVVVVVDTDRLYRECTACGAATAQIQTLMTQAQQRAQLLSQPIQTEAQAIQQAADAVQKQPAGAARTAAETALRTRAEALRQKETAANRELQQLDQSIQSTRQNVLRQINEKLNPIYQQVMTTRGANIAVDTGATLASASSLDVTNDVLAALNQQLPSVSVTPMPPPAPPQGQQPATPPPPGR